MQNNLIKKEESTLVTFEEDEKWEVKTSDRSFILNGKQAQALKDLTNSGSRGIAWFKDFAISIPFIISVERIEDSQKVIERKRSEFIKGFSKVDPTLDI